MGIIKWVWRMFYNKKIIKIETNRSDLVMKVCFNKKYNDKFHSVVYLFKKFWLAK